MKQRVSRYPKLITIWLFNIAMENPLQMEVLMGKSNINGPFSIVMLVYQRVYKLVVENNIWYRAQTACRSEMFRLRSWRTSGQAVRDESGSSVVGTYNQLLSFYQWIIDIMIANSYNRQTKHTFYFLPVNKGSAFLLFTHFQDHPSGKQKGHINIRCEIHQTSTWRSFATSWSVIIEWLVVSR